MRRLVINSLLIMLAFLTTVPVFAADANYDSNGVTAFYGKYEYPKEDPEKEQPSKKKKPTIRLYMKPRKEQQVEQRVK